MDLSATINNDESNNSDIYSPRTFLLQDVPLEPMFSEPPEQRLDEQSLLKTDLIASPTASQTTSLPKDNNQYQFYYPQPVCSLPPVDTTMTNSITADSSHDSAVSLNYPSTSASGVAKIEANGKKKKKSKGDGCRCQQSKCLKLYCACFRDSQLCSESCRCASCENTAAESVRMVKSLKLGKRFSSRNQMPSEKRLANARRVDVC